MKIYSFKGSLQVRMSAVGRREYPNCTANPHDLVGYVTSFYDHGDGDYWCHVDWPDNYNSYKINKDHCEIEPVMFPEQLARGF